MENYYQILGLNDHNGVTQEDIKQAYKKLVIKWHPDKCKEPNATEMFKNINNAYQVLSDPVKRKEYDSSLKTGHNFQYHYRPPMEVFKEFIMMFLNINDELNQFFNFYDNMVGIIEVVEITDEPRDFTEVFQQFTLPFFNMGDNVHHIQHGRVQTLTHNPNGMMYMQYEHPISEQVEHQIPESQIEYQNSRPYPEYRDPEPQIEYQNSKPQTSESQIEHQNYKPQYVLPNDGKFDITTTPSGTVIGIINEDELERVVRESMPKKMKLDPNNEELDRFEVRTTPSGSVVGMINSQDFNKIMDQSAVSYI